MSDIRGYAAAQRAWDAREAPECYEPEPPEWDDDEDPVCILGELACRACGQTGSDWDNGKCFTCGGRGVVLCPGCGECGRGERPDDQDLTTKEAAE